MEQPINQQATPEQIEQYYINQVSQAVTQDTIIVQQQFQKYQNSFNFFNPFGMMNTADPRIWHVNHLFEFKHYIEGYGNIEAFLLSHGLTQFSNYLNLIRADITNALVTYGAVPQQPPPAQQVPPSDHFQQMMKIQQDLNNYITKGQLDMNKKWQETFDKTNKNWSDNF